MSAAEQLPTRKFETVPLRVKFATDDTVTGLFSGYASTFNDEPDSYGDVIAPGAFTESLARHKTKGTRPAMLWQHDQTQPVGVWEGFEETKEGLLAHGRLAMDLAQAKDAYALMKSGALALSIGYTIDPKDEVALDNAAWLIKKVNLVEVSLVALPANTNARITSIKSAFDPENPNPRIFEKAARDALGLSAAQAKRLMSGGWRDLARDESGHADDLAKLAAKLETVTKSLRG